MPHLLNGSINGQWINGARQVLPTTRRHWDLPHHPPARRVAHWPTGPFGLGLCVAAALAGQVAGCCGRTHPPTHPPLAAYPAQSCSNTPTGTLRGLAKPFQVGSIDDPSYPSLSSSFMFSQNAISPPSAEQRRVGGDRRQQGYSDGRPKRCRRRRLRPRPAARWVTLGC